MSPGYILRTDGTVIFKGFCLGEFGHLTGAWHLPHCGRPRCNRIPHLAPTFYRSIAQYAYMYKNRERKRERSCKKRWKRNIGTSMLLKYITPPKNQPATNCLFSLYLNIRVFSTKKKTTPKTLHTGIFKTNILLGPITAAGVAEAFQGLHQFLNIREFLVGWFTFAGITEEIRWNARLQLGNPEMKKPCIYMKTGYWQNRGHWKDMFSRSCLTPTPLCCQQLPKQETAWKGANIYIYTYHIYNYIYEKWYAQKKLLFFVYFCGPGNHIYIYVYMYI